jgi:hypothetical protein
MITDGIRGRMREIMTDDSERCGEMTATGPQLHVNLVRPARYAWKRLVK